MKNEEKKKLEQELENLYKNAINTNAELQNTDQILANNDDIGDISEIEAYDYEKDIEEALEEAKGVIDKMSKLYLGENETLQNHPYLTEKKKHDASNQGDMIFIQKMAKRAIIKQLQTIDLGDTSYRNFEVFYNGLKEIRDNIKQSTSSQSVVEGFYKDLKEDLGISATESVTGEESSATDMMDEKELNKRLDEAMKKKDKK